jgi:hypothetical protein
MRSNLFDRLSFLSLFLVIVLLPVFALPFTNFAVETSKGLLLVVGLAVSLILWSIARFTDGKIVIPKSWLLLSGLGVVIVTLVSALLSQNSAVSLFGSMFDLGSFWFILAAFMLLFLCSIVFRNPKHAKIILLGTILSSALVLIFQTAHFFLPDMLSLGVLSEKTSNLLGSWNALGLFAGFACLMFLLVIEFFAISKVEKIVLEIFVLLSILVAAAINFSLVWILLGISSLIIFVYKLSISFQSEEEGVKYFPAVSFVVVIVCLLFFMGGQFVSGFLSNKLQVSNTEVGPSLGSTSRVTWNILKDSPLVGIGPNRFGEAWSMYKPASINKTQFWNVYFETGSGLLPTLVATTGSLGLLSWLVFFALFLYFGVKSVFSSIRNRINWEMMAFFILSLYLFVASFLYFSGAVIFLLSLAFTGVFIGLSASSNNREFTLAFLNDHRKSFFSILALIVIVILSIGLSLKFIERFASVSYFRDALLAKDIPGAEVAIAKALSLNSNDLYLRTYAQIYLLKVNSLAQKEGLSEEEKKDLQSAVDQTVNSAQLAISLNPSNYLNYQLLGGIYQALGTIGVKNSYESAMLAYENAAKLNPLNPALKLAMAQVLEAQGKRREALPYAEAALALLPGDRSIEAYVNSLKNGGTPASSSNSSNSNNDTEDTTE